MANKKRKKPNHIRKQLTEAERKSKARKEFLNNYMWLITLVAIIILMVLCFWLIPSCDISCAKTDIGTTTAENESDTDYDPLNPSSEDRDFIVAPDGYQLLPPEPGEEVAILETNYGTIKFRLFPAQAPLAVENFRGLVASGYYDGVIFHRVINGFMIQGGDPTGTGGGGASIWGGTFNDEFGRNLFNFRGALSMANSGDNTNGSQFFIVQAPTAENVETLAGIGMPQWAVDVYNERGGTPHLDGQFKQFTGSGHTVFGQVYEGMDVVDAIAAVPTLDGSTPVEDVVILSARLEILG